MTMKWAAVTLAGLLMGVTFAGAAKADGVLDEVKKRGQLIVGSKTDFAPFGALNSSGEPAGFEVDLARDVAKRLGVELKIVPVVSANRMQFLQQGKIDLMIATMSYRPERAEAVEVVQPAYYASAQSLLAPKNANPKLTKWEELKDKKVCGVQGAFYNADVATFGAQIVNFKDTAEALNGLKDGKCVGMAFDVTFFAGKLQEADWAGYELPLPSRNDDPWVLAVKKGETAFHEFMVGVVKDWHKSGKLIELEGAWKLPASSFLKAQKEKAS